MVELLGAVVVLVVLAGLGAIVAAGFWLGTHVTAQSQTTDPFTIHDRQRAAERRARNERELP